MLGTFAKPLVKKEEFFKGGVRGMQLRFKTVLAPFNGAYGEFLKRTDGCNNVDTIITMWDYVRVE